MISNCGKDEKGKLTGGQAGDQTKNEWENRPWYSRPWTCVLRYADEKVGKEIATVARAAANNDKIGYDQSQRLTYFNELKKAGYEPSKITTACEADCSAGVAANVIAVGFRLGIEKFKTLNPSMVTSNERAALKAIGFEVLTENKYLSSDAYLIPGDILLYDGYHTATNLDTGSKAGSGSTGGTPSSPPQSGAYSKADFVKEVQTAIGAKVDGMAGPETLSKTITVSAKKNAKSKVVKPLQKRLNALGYSVGVADGEAGPKFTAGVNKYQKEVMKYSKPDGEVTAKNKMWKSLLGMA